MSTMQLQIIMIACKHLFGKVLQNTFQNYRAAFYELHWERCVILFFKYRSYKTTLLWVAFRRPSTWKWAIIGGKTMPWFSLHRCQLDICREESGYRATMYSNLIKYSRYNITIEDLIRLGCVVRIAHDSQHTLKHWPRNITSRQHVTHNTCIYILMV